MTILKYICLFLLQTASFALALITAILGGAIIGTSEEYAFWLGTVFGASSTISLVVYAWLTWPKDKT